MKQKLLSLALASVLLLGVLCGCSPEPVTMIWTYNDYGYSSWGPSIPLRALWNDPSTDGALFCIAIEDDGEEKDWTFETYEATESEWLNNDVEYVAATVTKEELTDLIENESLIMQLTVPARPEGYPETIADSLVATMEYTPQETYPIRVYTTKSRMYDLDVGKESFNEDRVDHSVWYSENMDNVVSPPPYGYTNDEMKTFMDDLMERYDILGKYKFGSNRFDPTTGKMNHVHDMDDKGYGGYPESKGDGTGDAYWKYTGWFETTATAEQILALAEDDDVVSIYPGIVLYSPVDYYITTIKGEDISFERVKREKLS